MGLTLPGELERLLNDLGFTWPEVDEQELFEVGGEWCSFGSVVAAAHQSSTGATEELLATNQSAGLDAFSTRMQHPQSPLSVLGQASTGVEAVGAAMYCAAGLVLGLKINTMINLIALLCEIISAIAEAVPTFGASLAEIPVFKEITNRIINAIVNEAVNAILS
ncbi:hypothetical protein [uncultured Jatrophihabitans sp.]|uniref:WXG100-like domain-containing protein n=1 Tax=uncultured Jatrophihabitans sp. TaxID=1610747 RepID=UPI0035CA491B